MHLMSPRPALSRFRVFSFIPRATAPALAAASAGLGRRTRAIALCLAATMAAQPATAAMYYVNSALGHDGNPGTEEAPFRSFEALRQRKIRAGDTICFAAGTRYAGDVDVTASGESGRPITLTRYGGGPAPEFSNPGQEHAIRLSGHHLVLDGVKLTDTLMAGVTVAGRDCTVQNCEMTGTGFGVSVEGHDVRIRSNYIHDLHIIKSTPGGDDDYGAVAINITAPTDGAEVAWNRIERCIAPCLDYGKDGGAFEFYGDVRNVAIHHNRCEGNNGVFEFGGGAIANVRFFENVCLYNVVLGGFHLTGKFAGVLTNIRFEHNTVVEAAAYGNPTMLWFDGTARSEQFSVTNNIFHYRLFQQFSNGSGFVHTDNLYYSPDHSPLGFAKDATEIEADPRFVDVEAHDLRLPPDSPARRDGAVLGYTGGGAPVAPDGVTSTPTTTHD